MAHVSKDTLRFMIGQVDWTAIMHELVDTQPETVANLMNDHFKPEPEENDPGESGFDLWVAQRASKVGLRADLAMGLDRAFTHVARAVNTSVAGRVTTADKIKAIKELRGAFGLTLKDAKDEVEFMMERYEADPSYYPNAESWGPGLGYKFS